MKYDKEFLELINAGVYKCDSSGEIWNCKLNKLCNSKDETGYIRVGYVLTSKPYKKISIRGHRLVWIYFNGPIPSGMVVNHKDKNKSNNSLDNLELLSVRDNNRHARGLGSENAVPKQFSLTPHSEINQALYNAIAAGKYWCDAEGNVYSKAKNRKLAAFNHGGYLGVSLDLGLKKRGTITKAHRVVWTYFNGLIPDGQVINHIDGNKKNNRISNLECVTHSANMKHAYDKLGKMDFSGDKSSNALFSNAQVLEMRRKFANNLANRSELIEQTGVTASNLTDILSYRCFKDVGVEYRESCQARNQQNKVGKAKFTDQQIIDIFKDYYDNGLGYRRLAVKYSSRPEGIMRIITRKSYQHVSIPSYLR